MEIDYAHIHFTHQARDRKCCVLCLLASCLSAVSQHPHAHKHTHIHSVERAVSSAGRGPALRVGEVLGQTGVHHLGLAHAHVGQRLNRKEQLSDISWSRVMNEKEGRTAWEQAAQRQVPALRYLSIHLDFSVTLSASVVLFSFSFFSSVAKARCGQRWCAYFVLNLATTQGAT